jgi:cytochrome c5
MKSLSVAAAAIFLLFASALVVLAQKPAPQERPRKPAPAAASNESAEGEKRFEMHCGRCHVPPDDLSPREAKAVLRQMRVRANLSAEDERLILKYLAP